MTMNKRVKKLWLEALRSGDYKQGKLKLRNDDNEFCCLGVLCDLYAKEHGKRWGKRNGSITFMLLSGVPPNKVWEWAGLSDANPRITTSPGSGDSLAGLNDTGSDFSEIANLIEAKL